MLGTIGEATVLEIPRATVTSCERHEAVSSILGHVAARKQATTGREKSMRREDKRMEEESHMTTCIPSSTPRSMALS